MQYLKTMKSTFILLFLCLFLGSGCKYFKKSSSRTIDTITADTGGTSTAIVDSAAYYSSMNATQAATKPAPASVSAVKGNYYMIVGCFTIQQNAVNYAEKLRGLGYETQIIPGRDNFQMVAARTYDNYRESVAEIDKFRNEVSPNAWVYRKK
jgi:hypothetical protein